MTHHEKRETYRQGWTRYQWSFIGHHIQGAAAALGVCSGDERAMTAGALWTVLYISYQGLTVIRKGDSAGLDVADYLVGFAAGLGIFITLQELGIRLAF